MAYEVHYGGQTYPLADAEAAATLEKHVTDALSGGNAAGAFVGVVTPSGTVRLLVSTHTPIAITGSQKGNPTMISGW